MTDFLQEVKEEVAFARKKFPGNHMMLAALMEEVGELAQALIDNERLPGNQSAPQHAYREAVQVACMAMRIAEEGSEEFKKYVQFNDSMVDKKA